MTKTSDCFSNKIRSVELVLRYRRNCSAWLQIAKKNVTHIPDHRLRSKVAVEQIFTRNTGKKTNGRVLKQQSDCQPYRRRFKSLLDGCNKRPGGVHCRRRAAWHLNIALMRRMACCGRGGGGECEEQGGAWGRRWGQVTRRAQAPAAHYATAVAGRASLCVHSTQPFTHSGSPHNDVTTWKTTCAQKTTRSRERNRKLTNSFVNKQFCDWKIILKEFKHASHILAIKNVTKYKKSRYDISVQLEEVAR